MEKVSRDWGIGAVRGDGQGESQERATKTRRWWRLLLLACASTVVLLCSIPHQTNANYNPPVCLPPNAPPLPSVGEEVDTVLYFTNGKTIKCIITEPWYCGGHVAMNLSSPSSFYTANPKDSSCSVVQLVRWDLDKPPWGSGALYGYRINVTTCVVSPTPVPDPTNIPNPDPGKPECNDQAL